MKEVHYFSQEVYFRVSWVYLWPKFVKDQRDTVKFDLTIPFPPIAGTEIKEQKERIDHDATIIILKKYMALE